MYCILRKLVLITHGIKQTFSLKREIPVQIRHIWAPPPSSSLQQALPFHCTVRYVLFILVVWNTDFCYMCLTPQPAVSRNQHRTEQVVPSASLLLLKISCDMPHVIFFFFLSLNWLMCKIRLMFKQCQAVRGRKWQCYCDTKHDKEKD